MSQGLPPSTAIGGHSGPATAPILLEVQALTKDFNGFLAVKNANLVVREGSIHALIGPNGAGKTTLFNLITKFLQPTSGRIFYKGSDITTAAAADLARRGVGRSFQISAVFAHLTVLENVRVALQRRLGTYFHFWRSPRSLNVLNERARELLSAVGLSDMGDRMTGELPYGRKRALELATTLALEPELLLLDEPTAGLGQEDIKAITRLIGEVARSRTVIMVEHNLGVVAALANTITVLQRGEVLAEGNYDEIQNNPEVRRAYLGSDDSHG